MLMKNECSVVSSIKVKLTFDDGTYKERVISTDDLVDVEYNANGLRKHIIGRVVRISAVGTDPKGWYIIVDGSDDFDSARARFSPTAILDIDILRKAYTLDNIQTPLDDTGIPYMRVVKGKYLQWSRDGVHWHYFHIPRPHIRPANTPDDSEPNDPPHNPDHIDDEDYVPEVDPDDLDNDNPSSGHCGCGDIGDGIEDAEY